MAVKKELKIISLMVGVSVILIATAFLTITNSFAYNNELVSRLFKIEVSSVESNNISRSDIQVRDTSFLFNISLDKDNNVNSFVAEFNNIGNIDSEIILLDKENIGKKELFTYNDKIYYLSDFVFYTVKNIENNIDNEIIADSDIHSSDTLNAKTTNKIEIKVRLKHDNELSENEKLALDSYLSESKINDSLYLNILYGEKK